MVHTVAPPARALGEDGPLKTPIERPAADLSSMEPQQKRQRTARAVSTSLHCLQQTTSIQRGFEPASAEAHTAQGSSESDGTGARPTSSPESEGGNGSIERLHDAGGSSIDG